MTQPSGAASQARSECDDAARRGGNTPEEKPTNYSFRLGVKYRRRSGNFDSSCYCNHVIAEDAGNEVRFGCGVDCEGGGINLALSKDSKSAIIRLERIVVWNRNKPDDDAADALLAGADDKIFRVDRAELRECAELVTDRQELAALRHKRQVCPSHLRRRTAMHRRNMLCGEVSAIGAAFAASRAGAATEPAAQAKLKLVYHLNELDKVNFLPGSIQNHLDGVGGPDHAAAAVGARAPSPAIDAF
jgi:hypothetical protein